MRRVKIVGPNPASFYWTITDADTGEELTDVVRLTFIASADIRTTTVELARPTGPLGSYETELAELDSINVLSFTENEKGLI